MPCAQRTLTIAFLTLSRAAGWGGQPPAEAAGTGPSVARPATDGPTTQPATSRIGKDVVFQEVDGVVAVEAEHFHRQELTETRAWWLVSSRHRPGATPDGDPPHLDGASGGAYLEILPDTRRSHHDPLRRGVNFSPQPGRMAILSYRVHFQTAGRYYVWARIYSTNTEDNGLHVGLDGAWPASGQRMQWTAKNRWAWGSKQRTAQVHTGVKHQLYLDIPKPGLHTISFSMREDGTEFDKWMMTREKLDRVAGTGPAVKLRSGSLPEAFPVAPSAAPATTRPSAERGTDGDGAVAVSGERRQWHTVTLDGPFADEKADDPNPFLDYRMIVAAERLPQIVRNDRDEIQRRRHR